MYLFFFSHFLNLDLEICGGKTISMLCNWIQVTEAFWTLNRRMTLRLATKEARLLGLVFDLQKDKKFCSSITYEMTSRTILITFECNQAFP